MIERFRDKLSAGTGLVLIAALALGGAIGAKVYRQQGHHISPDKAASESPLDVLAQSAESHPEDASGWQALAGAQFDAGRYADAAVAYGKALSADPKRAALWSGRGEARVMASQHDPMPDDALADFTHALTLDAKDPRARYFVTVKQDLGGDHRGAIAAWLALLADTPAGAPWEPDLRRTIAQVGKINQIPVAPRLAAVAQPPATQAIVAQAIPGPSANDLQAAAKIPPGEQRIMAEGMVAKLEDRLRHEPGNVDRWLMLMRSRMTLGETDKASTPLHDALAANPGSAKQLREQAEVLGVPKK